MERYVTFTELKQNLRAVKEAAREDVIHVRTSGQPGYVLCSFEVWDRRMTAAAARGAYRAHVEESIREGERDVCEGRLIPTSSAIAVNDDIAGKSQISESALRYLDLEYDDEQRLLLGQTLSELVRRPTLGRTIDVEYQGTSIPVRKFFSPPCDVIYAAGAEGSLIVYGFVRTE